VISTVWLWKKVASIYLGAQGTFGDEQKRWIAACTVRYVMCVLPVPTAKRRGTLRVEYAERRIKYSILG